MITSDAIALCALAFSVLSPVLSSAIDGRNRRKEKRMEYRHQQEAQTQAFYAQHRAEVVERYVSATGQLIKAGNTANFAVYGAAMGEIYLYTPPDLWPLLDKISEKLRMMGGDSAEAEFLELCKRLAEMDLRRP